MCLVKVVCYIETGFLNIPTPVKMTPYPPRLQFQTSWTGGILTQKMTLWRDECFGKVVHSIEAGFLSISTHVKMTTCPPRLQFQTLWTGGILTQKMTLWRDECLGESCSFYRDSCPEHLRSFQDHLCLLRLQLNKSSKA